MSMLKFIDRLVRIDKMIKRGSTGPSGVFAKRNNISRSTLMKNLNEMRELGAQIEYDSKKRSYVYVNDFYVFIGSRIISENKKPEIK